MTGYQSKGIKQSEKGRLPSLFALNLKPYIDIFICGFVGNVDPFALMLITMLKPMPAIDETFGQ